MKRVVWASLIILAVAVFAAPTAAQTTCTTIQQGTLVGSDTEPLTTGFNSWGYNYQAHIFNGGYCDAYQNADWCQPYANDQLEMKWNDAWLSNQDCNQDGRLDRPDDNGGSYRGTGAWVTNHQKGTYVDANGKKQRWEYFTKIVAAPTDATLSGSNWLAADGSVIGYQIWGDFAVTQEIYSDTGTGDHGVLYLTPYAAGLGKFTPKQ